MSRPAPGTMLMWVAGLVIAAAVVAGILATGSPRQQRLFRLDAIRTNHLASLQHAVQSFHERQGRLPSSLAEVDAQPASAWSCSIPATTRRIATAPSMPTGSSCARCSTPTLPSGHEISR
jgi:hypothetical protein